MGDGVQIQTDQPEFVPRLIAMEQREEIDFQLRARNCQAWLRGGTGGDAHVVQRQHRSVVFPLPFSVIERHRPIKPVAQERADFFRMTDEPRQRDLSEPDDHRRRNDDDGEQRLQKQARMV